MFTKIFKTVSLYAAVIFENKKIGTEKMFYRERTFSIFLKNAIYTSSVP